jgi:uncharacterized damage-inducible protein DinB
MTHDERVARARQAFQEAHGRFTARLKAASADAAERPPDEGGWSAAQIAWHVAAVNTTFAALISGARPAPALPGGFTERSWGDISGTIPAKLEASARSVPPPAVRIADALAALEASAEQVDAALSALSADRGSGFGITHSAFGTVTLYQVGEWATAHTIRHNAQAKRVLGG